ncbi:hypothetical protein BFN67_21590 [Pseudaminobacter manganicus]|uniref:Cobalt transporter n=1 Tax=Manganibacter manganicus TaxID=1873176 RepID=A0A1V8RNJ7_9HYPH|nr:hypothetical protein BFN67_21590 [Pseudaminobacter manganicus]
MLLVATLCVAVTAFALSAGSGKTEALGIVPDAMTAAHDHHSHSHDDDAADPDHSALHAADHSHDTPTFPVLIVYAIRTVPERLSGLPGLAVLAANPLPGDRPPQSLA